VLRTLWIAGAGIVPGAHASALRETFVADPARAARTCSGSTRATRAAMR
jgi:hypothetical protein